jgi:hypothetical protein
MNTFELKSQSRSIDWDETFNGLKSKYQSVKQNKVVRAIGIAIIAVASLFAIGGLFRILAWVTLGWNQLMSAFAGK